MKIIERKKCTSGKSINVFLAPRSLKLPVCNKKSFLKYKSMFVIFDICEFYEKIDTYQNYIGERSYNFDKCYLSTLQL